MDDIGPTHARILAALWQLGGSAWLEVKSEIHEAYKELPFWMLLSAEMSPLEAHRQFWRVVEPDLACCGDYRVTVSYKALADDHVLWLGFFDNEENMRRALEPEGWSKPTRQSLDQASFFDHGRTASKPARKKSGKKGKKRR